MKENKKGKLLSQEQVMKLLDSCYEKSVNGIHRISPPIDQLANDYLSKFPDPSKAAKSMIRHQIAKCTTSGVVTGFGGVLTLPVSIPANIGSVLYVQMRMITCTAYMSGLDVKSDQVQTMIYACLAGVSINEFLKQAGIKVGEKLTTSLIKKIPYSIIKEINQKVGFRLLTKFGETGVVNLGKLVPGVGAALNGGFDLVETHIIGDRAYKMFFRNDCCTVKNENVVDYIDV